jgi:hypothetical protein
MEYHRELQAKNNWDVSRANWLNKDLMIAKENKKIKKEREKEEKEKQKMLNKIARLRQD